MKLCCSGGLLGANSSLGRELPSDQFVRVHRSFVVAKDKIDKLERHQVTVRGHAVPVGASYLPQLQV